MDNATFMAGKRIWGKFDDLVKSKFPLPWW
jgi:hypothetical protein